MKRSVKRDIVNDRPRAEWAALIEQWVHDRQDREMLVLRLLDGERIEPLAERFGLSVVQTQFRINRAENQLFKHIKE